MHHITWLRCRWKKQPVILTTNTAGMLCQQVLKRTQRSQKGVSTGVTQADALLLLLAIDCGQLTPRTLSLSAARPCRRRQRANDTGARWRNKHPAVRRTLRLNRDERTGTRGTTRRRRRRSRCGVVWTTRQEGDEGRPANAAGRRPWHITSYEQPTTS